MLDNGTFGRRQHTADRWRDCDGDWYADLAMLMDPTFGGSDVAVMVMGATHLVAELVMGATHLVLHCGSGSEPTAALATECLWCICVVQFHALQFTLCHFQQLLLIVLIACVHHTVAGTPTI